MNLIIELARRAARLQAIPLVALATLFGACNPTENLTSASEAVDSPAEVPATDATDVSLLSAFRGGIPIGFFGMPVATYGSVYNGAFRSTDPSYMTKTLAGVKARGGKIVMNLAGKGSNYTVNGNFSLTKWKARVARYRNVNFSSYVKDGTLVAHYLIDEPGDSHNWGKPISGSTLEEMARYSKSLWPSLATVVRADANYLAKFSTRYNALDAAWAQYVSRKGNVADYIRSNISSAQKKGLALITGLNVTHGGSNKRELTASQVRSYGATLLASSYPCAFISWDYKSSYTRGAIHDAMQYLSGKARNRASKSCRSGSAGGKLDPGAEETPPAAPAPPRASGGKGGNTAKGGIVLTARKTTVKRQVMVTLKWRGAAGRKVHFYRNSHLARSIPNDGTSKVYPQRKMVFRYKICEAGASRCSNTVTIATK